MRHDKRMAAIFYSHSVLLSSRKVLVLVLWTTKSSKIVDGDSAFCKYCEELWFWKKFYWLFYFIIIYLSYCYWPQPDLSRWYFFMNYLLLFLCTAISCRAFSLAGILTVCHLHIVHFQSTQFSVHGSVCSPDRSRRRQVVETAMLYEGHATSWWWWWWWRLKASKVQVQRQRRKLINGSNYTATCWWFVS